MADKSINVLFYSYYARQDIGEISIDIVKQEVLVGHQHSLCILFV